MQQNQTIRIELNMNDSEIRNLQSIIQDLVTVSNNLSSSFQHAQSNIQMLGSEMNASESIFSTQRTAMTYLRDAAFMLGNDYDALVVKLNELAPIQSTAALATDGLAGSFNAKALAAKGATKAVKGLSWGLKALPFVGIAFAVFSLVSNLVRLITNLNSTSNAYENLSERIEQNRETHRNNMRNIDESARSTSRLVDRLLELDSQERRTTRSLREKSAIIAQLNSRNEGLNLTYCDQTKRLTSNSQEVLNNISARNGLNREVARSEALYDNLTKASLNLAATDLSLEEAIRERDEFNDYLDTSTRLTKNHIAEKYRLNLAVSQLTEQQNELQAEVQNTGVTWQESLTNIDTYIQNHGLTLETLSDSQREVLDQMMDRWQLYQERGTEIFQELGSATKMYTYVANENGEMVRKGLRATGATSYEVVEQMIDNMRRNREATEQWSENLDIIAERTSEGFAEHLRNLGPEAAAYIQNMVDVCEEKLKELEAEFLASGATATDNIASSMSEGYQHIIPMLEELVDNSGNSMQAKIEQKFPSIGESIPEEICNGIDQATDGTVKTAKLSGSNVVGAFGDGITEGFPQVSTIISTELARTVEGATKTAATAAEIGGRSSGESIIGGLNTGITKGAPGSIITIKALARKMQQSYRVADETNSLSRVYKGYGAAIVEGLRLGLDRMKPQAVRTIQSMAHDMHRVYDSTDQTYREIGQGIMNGLNLGLLNGEPTVLATARRIANQIEQTMQQSLQINSPSRVMQEKVGRFIPEGVAAGIDKYADVAMDSISDLTRELMNVKIPSPRTPIALGANTTTYANTGSSSSSVDKSITNNNAGLFDGCTIHWHNEEDIRRTMEKIAWVTQKESARMW